mgnify:FL=1
MKRIISKKQNKFLVFLLIAITFLFSVPMQTQINIVHLTARAASTGKCGTNLTWHLNDGVLTISGTGAMTDYKYGAQSPFCSNKSIEKVILEDGVTSIGNNAFYSCSGINEVTISESVERIGDYAFVWCTGLQEINIPDGVTSIGKTVFQSCKSLKKITIGSGLETLDSESGGMFFYCDQLMTFEVDDSNEFFSADNGVLFNKDKTSLICYPKGSEQTTYDIPTGVTCIGYGAFYGCKKLTKIKLPATLIDIGYAAFEGCDGITSISIPSKVESINDWAFYSCDNIKSIVLPNSVKKIGGMAFNQCKSLFSITILNPNCAIFDETTDIYDGSDTIASNAIIYGLKNSTAQAYAKKYNRKFLVVSNSESHFPSEYDPQKDRWNFSNQTIAIPKSIYKKAFGDIKGAVMYFKDCAFASKKPGEGGSCYGMAASTGTFVKNYIDVTSVLCQPISAPGLYASHLYQCWNGSGGIHDSYIPAANMTVSEFVMYGQLSQKDYDMSRQMKNSKYDFEGLYSATVDYVNGTGEPVVVSMVGELNGQRVGHAIYVCGIGVDNENYTEILVNDSNHPTDVPRKLILNKTNGSYSGWEYDLNSNTHWGTGKKYEKISYSFPSYFLYVVGICNSEMVAEKNSEWMSSEANLVVIDGDAEGLNIDDEKIYPIESSAGIGEIEEDVSGFWLEPGIDEISFISKNDESSIIFANNKVAVDVQTDKNVLTDLTIDEKNYYASIQANKGEKVTLAVHTQSSDNTEYEYTISGNVHENKVSVERNEDNIIFVKGLNNVDINLNKNGNEENTVAAVSDGRQIKISIDDSNNTVIASYEAEQTEDICGYCGKVHGTSFKEVLIKFFHRIFYFFVKLFGLKK